MKFLADMGVSQRVVEWLRAEGHDAIHLREQGLHRLANGKIFHKAAGEHRIVLTFDLDFGEILAMSGPQLASVVLFRLNNTMTPFVIQRLQIALRESGDVLETGAIIVVEDGRFRIRRLPIK